MSIKNNERLKIKIIIDCIFKTVGAIINCDLLKQGCSGEVADCIGNFKTMDEC